VLLFSGYMGKVYKGFWFGLFLMGDGISRRGLLKVIGAGAVGFFGGCDDAIEKVKEGEKVSGKYSYLDVYDNIIDNSLMEFNGRLKPDVPMSSLLVKAMIHVESGSPKHRDGAFKYDPLQIANKGDYGLDVLSKGLEHSYLIGDFSALKGMRHTSWRNGWDYSNSNLKVDSTLRGGIGFLFHKAVAYDVVERGEVLNYEIKSGENYFGICGKLGTTVESFIRNNPDVNPKKLQIWQSVNYRKSDFEVVRWRSWADAVKRYNGGGDVNCFSKVKKVMEEIGE